MHITTMLLPLAAFQLHISGDPGSVTSTSH